MLACTLSIGNRSMECTRKIGQVEFDFNELSVSSETLNSWVDTKNSVSERIQIVYHSTALYVNSLVDWLNVGWSSLSSTCERIYLTTSQIFKENPIELSESTKERLLDMAPIILCLGSTGFVDRFIQSEMKVLFFGGISFGFGAKLWKWHTIKMNLVLEKEKKDKRRKHLEEAKGSYSYYSHRIASNYRFVSLIMMAVGFAYLFTACHKIVGYYYDTSLSKVPQDVINELFKCPKAKKVWEEASREVGNDIKFIYGKADQEQLILVEEPFNTIVVKPLVNMPFQKYFNEIFGGLCNIRYQKEHIDISEKASLGLYDFKAFADSMYRYQLKSQVLSCETHLNCVKNNFWNGDFNSDSYCLKLMSEFSGYLETYPGLIDKAFDHLVTSLASGKQELYNDFKTYWDVNYKSIYESKNPMIRK